MRAALIALALCGCGDDEALCLEQYLDVDQGVYGQVIESCDTGRCSGPTGIPGVAINIWDGARATLIGQDVSDSLGMFQFQLDPGSYMACTAEAQFPTCIAFDVSAGAMLVRLKLLKPIGGWFCAYPDDCAR